METSYYQEHASELAQAQAAVAVREQEKKQACQQKDFHFVSANLLNFLPQVPPAEHEQVYLRICSMTERLRLEPDKPQLIERLEVEGQANCLENPSQLPALFCTYHLGSYRALIGFLAKAGVDFVLAMGGTIYQQQRDKIREQVTAFQQVYGKKAFFEAVDVTTANATLELTTHLTKGRSVVAYVDSNTGVGGVYQRDDSMLRFNFLGKPIYARKGLSVLSFLTKRPLIPVISYYKRADSAEDTTTHLRFYPPIHPPVSRDGRNDYFISATTRLYEVLAKALERYYDQWEGWVYVHKYLDFASLKATTADEAEVDISVAPNAPLAFNKARYGLFKINEEGYLFDKKRYSSIKLSASLFGLLNHPDHRCLPPGSLSPSLLQGLVAREILVDHLAQMSY